MRRLVMQLQNDESLKQIGVIVISSTSEENMRMIIAKILFGRICPNDITEVNLFRSLIKLFSVADVKNNQCYIKNVAFRLLRSHRNLTCKPVFDYIFNHNLVLVKITFLFEITMYR